MTLTFDKTVYSNLLSEYRPQVIETEEEYDRALAIALCEKEIARRDSLAQTPCHTH